MIGLSNTSVRASNTPLPVEQQLFTAHSLLTYTVKVLKVLWSLTPCYSVCWLPTLITVLPLNEHEDQRARLNACRSTSSDISQMAATSHEIYRSVSVVLK